jgi:hypothetical protein
VTGTPHKIHAFQNVDFGEVAKTLRPVVFAVLSLMFLCYSFEALQNTLYRYVGFTAPETWMWLSLCVSAILAHCAWRFLWYVSGK